MRDVPVVIEGPRPPMKRLLELLRALTESKQSAYSWTDPIMVSDELVLLAFRDRSLAGGTLSDGAPALTDHVLYLIRPVVFPFLYDHAVIAHMVRSSVIDIGDTGAHGTRA